MTIELRPLGVRCNLQCQYCYPSCQHVVAVSAGADRQPRWQPRECLWRRGKEEFPQGLDHDGRGTRPLRST